MFDVGALELLVISVVALIVVGPERLPKLARAAGLWVGRARRAFSSVKEEIDREIKADELKEILRKQSQSRPLDTILEEAVSGRPAAKSSGQPAAQASVSSPGANSTADAGPDNEPGSGSATADPPKGRA
ncbi:MAG: Sec-independent protein translocase protein TatB [Chromatiaceae bacterium]|nr:Sec-independent protein translocase protein TatB [Chromatiaceae bacterium]MCF7993919.1 Sec-independent protein translocase protein TatB [Chromatiaceae bacterium]MCF8015187.1 Sec-independent protein translocase protein TatB [Chromatiaceae bacterium]